MAVTETASFGVGPWMRSLQQAAVAVHHGIREIRLRHMSPKPVSRELAPTGTSAHSRLFAQVDFRREMRPIAFVDPGAFGGTNPRDINSGLQIQEQTEIVTEHPGRRSLLRFGRTC